MASGDAGTLLLPILVLFVAAKGLGWLATKLGQPSVVGELLGGVLMGPSLVAFVDPGQDVLLFAAEFGAILLLFEVGLDTEPRDLLAVGRSAVVVGLLGVVVSFFAGYGGSKALALAGVWRDDALFHVFVAATLTATSVGITARVLGELGALQTTEARIILGAAVLDDVAGLLILAVLGSLAAGTLTTGALVLKAGLAVGFLAVAVTVGLLVFAPLFGRIADREPEIGLALALAWGIGLALAAGGAGLAPLVGAFAAGLALARTAPRDDIVTGMKPVNEIFVPLFFGVVGARVDVGAAAAEPVKVLLVVGVLTVVAVLGKLACGLGAPRRTRRLLVGVGMVPRGEVGLIFAVTGLAILDLDAWVYASIVLVVLVTTLFTPPWLAVLTRRRPAGDVGGP